MSLIDNPVFEEYKNRCQENDTKPSLTGFITWNANIMNIQKRWHPGQNNTDSVTMVILE